MEFCIGCELMKKTEQITVHLTDDDKEFCSAKADILNISKSQFIAKLIAESRAESERQFHIMRKVHGDKESE